MTTETTTDAVPEALNQQEVIDFKVYYGQAVNGVLSSVPFGVTVDPNQLATVARNVAMSMIYAQREHLPEQLHEDEKSNFPYERITKDDVARVINALIAQDRGLAASVLAEFNVASVDKLDAADYATAYGLAYSKLAR